MAEDKGSREADVVLNHDPRIARGIQAWELLRVSMTGTVPLRRKRWRKLSPNRTLVGPKAELERDFTTQGTQGELKCPFSKEVLEIEDHHAVEKQDLSNAKSSKSNPQPDQCVNRSRSSDARSKSFSNAGSAPQCPIRFLKQFPAEDVAKYFEEHKHEIPRSHEVCVKRYQANEQSIRSLDAKYGNLVNMIQGLGEKHRPMLPSKQELEDMDEAIESDRRSIEKVEKWAEGCGEGPGPMDQAVDIDDNSDDRTGHFERPLKEVRLGESPSRPWGIQVPFNEHIEVNSVAPEKDSVAAPVQPTTQKDTIPEEPTKRPAGRCPFGHGTAPAPPKAESMIPLHEDDTREVNEGPMSFDRPENLAPVASNRNEFAKESPRIVFNGPVFFGYSAEDAASLMRSFQQS